MDKTIVCAGMYRSGSTWQFNAVRTLAEHAVGEADVASCWIGDYARLPSAAVHILKMHDPVDLPTGGAGPILTCHRDLRDAVSSMVRMKFLSADRQEVISWALYYVETLRKWLELGATVFAYETMMADPIKVLEHMSIVTGFELRPADLAIVARRLKEIRPPTGGPSGDRDRYDRTTLLHPGHFAGFAGAGPSLSAELRRELTDRFGDWLSSYGYTLDSEAAAPPRPLAHRGAE